MHDLPCEWWFWDVFICSDAGGMRAGEARAGSRLCPADPQRAESGPGQRCWEPGLHVNPWCADTQLLRAAGRSPLKWRLGQSEPLRHAGLSLPPSRGSRREGAECCACRVPRRTRSARPCRDDLAFHASVTQLLQGMPFPPLSWSELTQDGMSVHRLFLVLLHSVSFQRRPRPLPGPSLQTPAPQESILVRCHLCLLASGALCAPVPFVGAAPFQSLCILWHFSPSPRSLPLFLWRIELCFIL